MHVMSRSRGKKEKNVFESFRTFKSISPFMKTHGGDPSLLKLDKMKPGGFVKN